MHWLHSYTPAIRKVKINGSCSEILTIYFLDLRPDKKITIVAMDFLMGQMTCTPLFAPNVTFIFLLPFFPQFLTLSSLWVSHPKVLQKSSQPVPNFILIILKLTLFMTFNSSRVQPHKLFMLSLYFPFVLLV